MLSLIKLHHVIALAGIWSLANGILHDVFVLFQRRSFDRDLIRLLIDGHILIFSGIFYLLSYSGARTLQPLSMYVSAATAIFLLGYCALIFKMLPSWGMIMINTTVLILVVYTLVVHGK